MASATPSKGTPGGFGQLKEAKVPSKSTSIVFSGAYLNAVSSYTA